MKIAASARKHGITEADARCAATHPVYVADLDDDSPARQFLLGFDTSGRLPELVRLIFDSGNQLIIHAMEESLLPAISATFPWVRHLLDSERREFTLELVAALSDAAELSTDIAVQETIAGWRATARIKADPAAYAEARQPITGDFGNVDVAL